MNALIIRSESSTFTSLSFCIQLADINTSLIYYLFSGGVEPSPQSIRMGEGGGLKVLPDNRWVGGTKKWGLIAVGKRPFFQKILLNLLQRV